MIWSTGYHNKKLVTKGSIHQSSNSNRCTLDTLQQAFKIHNRLHMLWHIHACTLPSNVCISCACISRVCICRISCACIFRVCICRVCICRVCISCASIFRVHFLRVHLSRVHLLREHFSSVQNSGLHFSRVQFLRVKFSRAQLLLSMSSVDIFFVSISFQQRRVSIFIQHAVPGTCRVSSVRYQTCELRKLGTIKNF